MDSLFYGRGIAYRHFFLLPFVFVLGTSHSMLELCANFGALLLRLSTSRSLVRSFVRLLALPLPTAHSPFGNDDLLGVAYVIIILFNRC